MGFEDGADHFDGGAAGFGVAKGGAVFFNGGDELAAGGEVTPDVFAEIGEGFLGGETVAVNGLPGLAGAAGVEGAAEAEVGEGFGVDTEVDDAFIADELETEAGVASASVLDGVKEQREAVFHLEAGMDFVAGEGTDAFRAFEDMGFGDGLAILVEAGGAGFGGTHEDGGEVKEMATEHPKIERAAAGVLFASAADFEQAADGSFGDKFLAGLEGGVVAVAVGEREFGVGLGTGGDDFIRLLGAAAEGFLHVNAAGTGLGGGEDHGVMLIDVTWSDRDDVGFDLGEHDGVVEEAVFDLELGLRGCEALGVGISDGDDLGLREVLP